MLEKHAGRITDIARETGRSRKQVYRWLEQHGIGAKTFRAD
jgi:transposase-like protein